MAEKLWSEKERCGGETGSLHDRRMSYNVAVDSSQTEHVNLFFFHPEALVGLSSFCLIPAVPPNLERLYTVELVTESVIGLTESSSQSSHAAYWAF
ncbi:unnamed protein product [Brassica oleracea]